MKLHEEDRVTETTRRKIEASGLYSVDGRVCHLRAGAEVAYSQWIQFLSDDKMHPDNPLPFDD